jgi:hypothetical protein
MTPQCSPLAGESRQQQDQLQEEREESSESSLPRTRYAREWGSGALSGRGDGLLLTQVSPLGGGPFSAPRHRLGTLPSWPPGQRL